MLKVLDNMDKCYGCSSCENVCPTAAINMLENNEGFLEPIIDQSKCIDCKACINACPSMNTIYDNTSSPEVLAFQADEESLLKGSSGGAFNILASYTIYNNGVVFGAAFDKDWRVKHISADNEKDLKNLAFSKYLQSDLGKTFKEVKKHLDNGKNVLYIGCPCQIAGLKTFLGKKCDNLCLVDLVCHGVPSPGTFISYLNENFNLKRLKNLFFRSGEKWETAFNVEFENGEKEKFSVKGNKYLNSFLKDFNLRKTCFSCKFAKIPRQGDITLGDLWKASKMELNFPINKTSVVLINNEKGADFFYRAVALSQKVCHIKDINLKNKFLNRNIFKASAGIDKLKYRDLFFSIYKNSGFTKAYDHVFKSLYHYDIGMVLYMSDNYGSVATNVGLYKNLEKKGYTPIVMDSQASLGDVSKKFAAKYLNISSKYIEKGDHRAANDLCDVFIIGSDQSANWDLKGPKYYPDRRLLGFVDNEKLKLAYGISFGNERSCSDLLLRKLYTNLFKRFDAVSVRESYAVSMCKEMFGIEAEHVIDPVFLLDATDWKKIADLSVNSIECDYILAYILNPTEDKTSLIKKATEDYGLKAVIITDAQGYEIKIQKFNLQGTINDKPTFEDWLSYFQNAKYIITDSFHGLCFSVIFEKPFAAIKNRQKHRFDNLAAIMKLEANEMPFFDKIEEAISSTALFKELNYSDIRFNINEFIKRSGKWLEESLKLKPTHSKDKTDSILIDYADLYRNYLELQKKFKEYTTTKPIGISNNDQQP